MLPKQTINRSPTTSTGDHITSTAALSPALLPDHLELSDARRRLYEAAIVLFGDRGFNGVSVRDLATHLGLQPAALYAHVASKQQLLFELVCIGFEEHRDRVKAALLDAGREPTDQIRALTHAHVMLHLDLPALARITNREVRALTDEQAAIIRTTRAEAEHAFLDVIERGVRLGAFTTADPDLAVFAIGGMGIRAAEWWTPDSPHVPSHVADTYADFAVRLLT